MHTRTSGTEEPAPSWSADDFPDTTNSKRKTTQKSEGGGGDASKRPRDSLAHTAVSKRKTQKSDEEEDGVLKSARDTRTPIPTRKTKQKSDAEDGGTAKQARVSTPQRAQNWVLPATLRIEKKDFRAKTLLCSIGPDAFYYAQGQNVYRNNVYKPIFTAENELPIEYMYSTSDGTLFVATMTHVYKLSNNAWEYEVVAQGLFACMYVTPGGRGVLVCHFSSIPDALPENFYSVHYDESFDQIAPTCERDFISMTENGFRVQEVMNIDERNPGIYALLGTTDQDDKTNELLQHFGGMCSMSVNKDEKLLISPDGKVLLKYSHTPGRRVQFLHKNYQTCPSSYLEPDQIRCYAELPAFKMSRYDTFLDVPLLHEMDPTVRTDYSKWVQIPRISANGTLCLFLQKPSEDGEYEIHEYFNFF